MTNWAEDVSKRVTTLPVDWRPKVTDGLDFASTDDERVVVTVPKTQTQVRLTPPMLQLLQGCDGIRDEAALITMVAPALAPDLPLFIAKFEKLGLLEPYMAPGSTATAPSPRLRRVSRQSKANLGLLSRIRYYPPGTLEFALFNSDIWVHRLKVPTRLVMARPTQVLVWLLSTGGLGLWATGGKTFVKDLSNPITILGAAGGIFVLIVCIFLHELSHAGALAIRGGRVRRLGFMLLYGSPAMYCDISDAWRLPRTQRVAVALAGVRVNFFAAGTCGLVARVTTPGSLHDTAVVAAGSNLIMALINLCPLVKFDGYLALIGWLDEPHLRRTSMREASIACRYFFFGGDKPQQVAKRRIVFGIGSAVMGPVLVLVAATSYQPILLATFGVYGADLLLAVYSVGVFLLIRKFIRAGLSSRTQGASTKRVCVVSGTLLVCVMLALVSVQVPVRTPSLFYSDGKAGYLVIPASMHSPQVLIGQQVVLRSPGVFLKPSLGVSRICSRPMSRAVPVGAGSSILFSTSATTIQRVSEICGVEIPQHASGIAEILRGTSSLGYWLRAVVIDSSMVPFQKKRT